jgi:peptide deformylase
VTKHPAQRLIFPPKPENYRKHSQSDGGRRDHPGQRFVGEDVGQHRGLRQSPRPVQPRPQHHKPIANGVTKSDFAFVQFAEDQRGVNRQNRPSRAEVVEGHDQQVHKLHQIGLQRYGGFSSLQRQLIANLGSPGKRPCYNVIVALKITKYGHPVLREKGRRIDTITQEIRQLAAEMIETMYAAEGVGLAAQQVGRPLMLTVIDVTPSDQPWTISPKLPMPLILLNPIVSRPQGEQTGSEGCLSIPEVSGQIRRAAQVSVRARTLDGGEIEFDCTGLLARAVQHEVDHLNGILFIDRMNAATRASFAGKLKKMQKETEALLAAPKKSHRSLAKM